MVRKNDNEITFPEDLLRNCEKNVLDKTKISIKLQVKPIESTYEIPKPIEIIYNDKYACKNLLK